MTSRSHRSVRLSVLSLLRKHYAGAGLVLLLTMLIPAARAQTATATTTATATATTLAISPTSPSLVPYKTPIILTATVTTTDGSPVSAGFVLFCDATATFCENNSALGRVQLTSKGDSGRQDRQRTSRHSQLQGGLLSQQQLPVQRVEHGLLHGAGNLLDDDDGSRFRKRGQLYADGQRNGRGLLLERPV